MAEVFILANFSRNQIIKKLAQLAAKKEIEETERGKFKIVPNINTYTGILEVTSKGTGYVIVEDLEEGVFIPNNNLNKALNGDEVEVYIYRRKRRGKSEGEISKIISRKKSEFVGVIEIQKNYAFVNMQDGKMYTDIFVPKNKIGEAEDIASMANFLLSEHAKWVTGQIIHVDGGMSAIKN